MSRKCIINNYQKNQKIRIPDFGDSNPSIDDLVMEITKKYNRDNSVNIAFSLSKNLSTNPNEFEESLNDFIDEIIRQLSEQKINFNKDELKSKLQSYYLISTITVKEDQSNEADLKEAKVVSIDEQKAIELQDILDELFNNNYAIKSHFLQEFKHKLKDKTIIHIDETIKKSRIVFNTATLNQSITEFMNQLYQSIYGYMKENNISIPHDKITNMFVQDDSSNRQYRINPGYIDNLNSFYNSIINNSNYQDILEVDFHNKILGNKHNNTLLEAVQSYVGIMYFDELMRQTLSKYIYINNEYAAPITYDKNGSAQYKYTINRKNVNLKSGWHQEVSDGIAEMGDFSIMCIETIPLKNKYGYLTRQDFIISFMKLKNLVQNITDKNSTLYRAKVLIKSNPVEAWKIILEYIKNSDNKALNKDSNSKILLINKSIKNHKITENDWNIYVSVYDYIFDKGYYYDENKNKILTNPGVYYIEQSLLKSEGITDNYSITNSIFGTLNSISDMNYFIFKYDQKDGEWKGEEKSKYYADQNVFQIKYSINKNARNIIGAPELLYSYDFEFGDNISFKIGNNRIFIKPTDKTIDGIFNVNDSSNKFEIVFNGKQISKFDEYFKVQLRNIMEPSKRATLISGTLSDKDLEFMLLLKAFDNLFGTNYSSNEVGLQEFRILYDLNNKCINTLILESGHILSSLFINRQFNDNRGTEYTFKELTKWISKQNYPYLKNIDRFSRKDKLKFIEETKEGDFLLGFSSNKLLDDMGDARTIILGDDNKSTIKNFNNDPVPNTSVAYTDFVDELIKQENFEEQYRINNNEKTPVGHLLFTGKSDAIKTVVVDTEIKMPDGTSKQVSQFTASELLYHSIYNKFFLFGRSGQWLSQPITYSDKTKFLNLLIDIKSILGEKNPFKISNEQFEQKIMDTIGNYYKQLYRNIARDYRKIFEIPNTVNDYQTYIIANQKFEELNNSSSNPLEDFLDKAYQVGVEVFEDLHYRKSSILNANGQKVDGIDSSNELLAFLNNTFGSATLLHNLLEEEKLNFVNSLLEKNVIFPITDIQISIENNIRSKNEDPKQWINKKGLLILGKITNPEGKITDIITGNKINLKNGEVLTLNPILETYFYMHNLIDNNAKLHFSGNELVHKLKSLGNIKNSFVSTLSIEEKEYIKNVTKKQNISLEDAINSSHDKNSISNSIRFKLKPYLKQVLSGEHNAQFKRTVPIPGTMRLFDQNRIDGIANKYKVSVIQDIQAEVNDLSGNYGYNKSKTIDAHDGSALIDPFTSILENKSLSESECGNVKKPLWDIDEPQYGTRRLVKYASNAITNEIMRNSARGASINMYQLFKKMTNFRWNGNIDLTNWDAFGWNSDTFKLKILRENNLYYKKGNEYYKILDFGKTDGIYWTKEQQVDNAGIPIANSISIKYHSFDEQGTHFISNAPLIHPNATHTIDSLFELHKVFGGINSVSLINNQFVYGEDSNYVVVAFMNGVTYANDNYRKLQDDIANERATKRDLVINQTYYNQPLKHQLINVVINQSAIKNGASNINSSDTYYNDKPLRYSIFSTSKYGIQLDADHNADEAEVTETSQVISALDATGIYHDEVLEIYKALGRQTLKASDLEIKVTKLYLQSLDPNNLEESIQNKIKNYLKKNDLTNSDLQKFILNNPKDPTAIQIKEDIRNKFDGIYDTIGRIIINNIKGNKAGLTSSIIGIIKEQFNLSDSHIYDKFKIPFSDPNIYSNILSTVSSVLNKKSIKRKYPGTGQVMVPSYGIYQTYEINLPDGTVQYLTGQDLLKRAINWNDSLHEFQNSKIQALNSNDYSDIEQFNNDVVQHYLINNIKNEVVYNGEVISDWVEQLSSLNPTDNVTIKYNDASGVEHSYDLTLDSLIKYYKFTENPLLYLQNLKLPILNILSIEKNNRKPKDLAPMKINFTYINELGEQKSINLFNTWIYRELFKSIQQKDDVRKNNLQARLQNFVTKLDEGLYEQKDGTYFKIIELKKKAAQTIQSYNYRSLFGIKDGDTLADIKDQGINYFKNQFNQYNPMNSNLYDYDFQIRNLNNKDNIYISIDGSTESKNLFTSKVIKWKTSLKHIENVNDGKIINRIYIMSEDNRKLFEIARDLDVSDQYVYDKKENIIKDKEGNKITDKDIFYSRGKILKKIQFLTQYKIFPTNGKAFIKYNIDRNALNSVLLTSEKPENAVRRIVQHIFESNNYLFIQPADIIRTNKYNLIKDIIKNFEYEYKDTALGKYYGNLVRNVFSRAASSLNSDLVYLNSGWKPSKEELSQFGIKEIPQDQDIFDLLRRNRKNFTSEQNKLFSNLWARYINSQLSSNTLEFIDQYSVERYNSFLKSLFVTSSRIPAQELQSFMQMETIGFTGIGSNIAAVSHFQMFLQGSDLDIDKSYMMGLVMDNNGRYLGWSDLFDLSSLQNIEASETLPFPQGREYIKSENGLVIDENEYNNAQTKAQQLIAIGKILKRLNKQQNVELNISDKLLSELNKHESTKIPVINEENVLKNYISSNIQQLIQRTGNILSAYTPIDLNVLNSAKPKSSINLNLFNPATVFIMQYENMTGKQVTGVSANGQKGQFMWRFATIDGLNDDEDEYVNFNITINRVAREKRLINGQITERIVPKTLNTLPNINLDKVANKLKLITKIYPSNVLSQYISAATDNAKELILAVINSGNKLAKCHLYLASLGFDVQDIVKFMTSPAVSFINEMSESNIFINHNVKMEDVIKYIINFHNIMIDSDETIDSKLQKLSKLYLKNSSVLLKESILQKLNSIYIKGKYVDDEGNNRNSVYEDTIDFKNILSGANEFSNLGRGLGINQGVATVKEKLTGFKNFLNQIITTAENEKGIFEDNSRNLKSNQTIFTSSEIVQFKEILENGFDTDKWLSDQNYKKLVNNYYNKLKHTINIFYIFDKLPHFNSMFKIANCVNIIDGNLSLKSILFNKFHKELKAKYKFIPPKYEDNLLKAIDEVLIENFISKIDFKLFLQEDWNIINRKFQLEKVNSSRNLNVARNPSAFKFVFENYVIPMLKNVEELKHNNFIQNLVQAYDQNQDIPLYKANIDLLRKDSSPELYLKYQDLVKGLRELKKYEYSGQSLTDWFILYNLIVNKNKYGSERLTSLFEDILKGDDKSLIFNQLKNLGDEDYYKTSLNQLLEDVTLTDLLIKIAPTVSVETGRQEPFIISYNPKSGFIIKERKGFNYYPFINLVVPIEGESLSQQEERVIRQQQYGFGLIFSRYVKNMMDQIDTNVEVLNTLIQDGIFNYLIDCK